MEYYNLIFAVFRLWRLAITTLDKQFCFFIIILKKRPSSKVPILKTIKQFTSYTIRQVSRIQEVTTSTLLMIMWMGKISTDCPWFYISIHRFIELVDLYIVDQPHYFGELLASEHHACQMKLGRALLRLNESNQSAYVDPDSVHHRNCIDQAAMSENVSHLAKVLAECELGEKWKLTRTWNSDDDVISVTWWLQHICI